MVTRRFHKILVIRRDNIGDLLCTTPLLSSLRKHYPTADIRVLCNSYNAPVLNNNPDINHVYFYTKAKHSHTLKFFSWWHEWKLFWKLREERFDLIINANPVIHQRTARLVRYLNPGNSVGVDGGEGVYTLPLQTRDIQGIHHVEHVHSLLRPLGVTAKPGALTLITKASRSQNNISAALIVGIHLSSRKPNNRWPKEYYQELIQMLLCAGFQVHLFWAPGSQNNPKHPGDDEKAAAIVKIYSGKITPIATRTLNELINAIDQCDLLFCPDGGTMHIATALQKPLVALFGCTATDIWGPWGNNKTQTTLDGAGNASHIPPQKAYQTLITLSSNLVTSKTNVETLKPACTH